MNITKNLFKTVGKKLTNALNNTAKTIQDNSSNVYTNEAPKDNGIGGAITKTVETVKKFIPKNEKEEVVENAKVN